MKASEDLIFADGHARATRVWEPASGGRAGRGRFLLLHGMESHSGWFEALGTALAARGFAASAYDRRGFGASGGARGDLPRAEDALAELHLAGTALCQDGEPCHVAGMSWGGLTAALYGAASVTLLAPALFPTRRLAALDYLKVAASVAHLRSAVALPLTPSDFTKNPEKQAFVAADPGRVTRVTARFLLATWRLQRAARAFGGGAAVKALLLAGDDAMIDNARTRRFAGERGFTVDTLPGAAHSLVLEGPDWVADRLVATARRAEAAP